MRKETIKHKKLKAETTKQVGLDRNILQTFYNMPCKYATSDQLLDAFPYIVGYTDFIMALWRLEAAGYIEYLKEDDQWKFLGLMCYEQKEKESRLQIDVLRVFETLPPTSHRQYDVSDALHYTPAYDNLRAALLHLTNKGYLIRTKHKYEFSETFRFIGIAYQNHDKGVIQ